MAPTLCLITDRRRLARSLSLPLDQIQSALIEQVRGAIRGGVDVVQVREPDLDAREYARLVRRIVEARSGAGTRIVVNDRADVALAARADGVHLREASISVGAARLLLERGQWVGRSVHDAVAASYGADADYLIAGSVFETASKPGARGLLGLDGLRRVVEAAGSCPVWAVGGVTPERVAPIVESGARGIAAIGGFIPVEVASGLSNAVEKLARKWRFSFDTAVELF